MYTIFMEIQVDIMPDSKTNSRRILCSLLGVEPQALV